MAGGQERRASCAPHASLPRRLCVTFLSSQSARAEAGLRGAILVLSSRRAPAPWFPRSRVALAALLHKVPRRIQPAHGSSHEAARREQYQAAESVFGPAAARSAGFHLQQLDTCRSYGHAGQAGAHPMSSLTPAARCRACGELRASRSAARGTKGRVGGAGQLGKTGTRAGGAGKAETSNRACMSARARRPYRSPC